MLKDKIASKLTGFSLIENQMETTDVSADCYSIELGTEILSIPSHAIAEKFASFLLLFFIEENILLTRCMVYSLYKMGGTSFIC